MKHFLDFYIKDISIPPGFIKLSNKNDFKLFSHPELPVVMTRVSVRGKVGEPPL